MIAAHLMTTPVWLLKPGKATDRYGGSVPDWENGVERTQVYGFRWDNVSHEVLEGRDALIEDTQLFLPPTAKLTGRERVEIDGQQFEIVGQPMIRRTPDGPHHTEARIRAVSG